MTDYQSVLPRISEPESRPPPTARARQSMAQDRQPSAAAPANHDPIPHYQARHSRFSKILVA